MEEESKSEKNPVQISKLRYGERKVGPSWQPCWLHSYGVSGTV